MKIVGAVIVLVIGGLAAAVVVGGPDLIYARVPEPNSGPSSLPFEDADPGNTIGGVITFDRAPDETGVEMCMAHWGLQAGNPCPEDDAGKGDHDGRCKGVRDTNHVAMARPSDPGATVAMEIRHGTQVPRDAVYLERAVMNGR